MLQLWHDVFNGEAPVANPKTKRRKAIMRKARILATELKNIQKERDMEGGGHS
jgi:hypothetical protein